MSGGGSMMDDEEDATGTDPLEQVLVTMTVAFHYGIAHGIGPDELAELCETVLEDVRRVHGMEPVDTLEPTGVMH